MKNIHEFFMFSCGSVILASAETLILPVGTLHNVSSISTAAPPSWVWRPQRRGRVVEPIHLASKHVLYLRHPLLPQRWHRRTNAQALRSSWDVGYTATGQHRQCLHRNRQLLVAWPADSHVAGHLLWPGRKLLRSRRHLPVDRRARTRHLILAHLPTVAAWPQTRPVWGRYGSLAASWSANIRGPADQSLT